MERKSEALFPRLERLRAARQWTWKEVSRALDLSVTMLMMTKSGERGLSKKAEWRLLQAEAEAGLIPAPGDVIKRAFELANESDGPEARLAVFETAIRQWTESVKGTGKTKQAKRPDPGQPAMLSDHDDPPGEYDASPTLAELGEKLYGQNTTTYELMKALTAAALQWEVERKKKKKK